MQQAPEGIRRFDPAERNVALMRSIWGPLERGESDDLRPFFDALADDVVFRLPVGELHGRQAVIDYFANAAAKLDFRPYEKPLEYYGDGDRVVVVGDETFRVKETGATHRADWAWIFEVHDREITAVLAIQDLSGVADEIREAVANSGS
jgi:ketosteroid isomerase-like protein